MGLTMGFGDFIDACIEPFAPVSAARRRSARIALGQLQRQYDAAQTNRRTQGWRRPSTSANVEIGMGLAKLRASSHDLTRNNKYANAALKQMNAQMVGDGIALRCEHDDKTLAKTMQDEWDRWAESKVDGQNDFYGVQRLDGNALIEGGEALNLWGADADGPDGRITVLEGDYLDLAKTQALTPGRITQGVQFDASNFRSAYWLFDNHPGDVLLSQSRAIAAEYVDHVYDQERPGQVRGVPWLTPSLLELRDIADIEDSVRLKKKVEACLAVILTPDAGQTASPLTGETKAADVAGRPETETLRPGLIFRTKPGETATTLNPTGTGDTVQYLRYLLMGISASLVPYHLMTGDPSQANYSSLRAMMLGSWALLDVRQQHIFIPNCCQPAFVRRRRRAALEKGDKRLLQVKAVWTPPPRPFVDPLKDVAAEVAEIRAGLKTLPAALTARGINIDGHLEAIAAVNKLIDQLGLALEIDPRRLATSGVLQAAAGWLRPQDNTSNN
jgi:lambda family phage portal protein